MPKISSTDERIYINGLATYIKITIMYNQKHKFYFVIPDQYKDSISCASSDFRNEVLVEKNYKKRGGDIYNFITCSDNENDCKNQAIKIIKYCIDNKAVDEDVIIMFYNGNKTTRYNNHRYNTDHPQIGLQIGLTYAIRTHIGEKEIFYQRTGHDLSGRYELNLWNESATILPDTPENRKVLEDLYNRMKHLNDQLADFTKTPESLTLFIDSKVKLLK